MREIKAENVRVGDTIRVTGQFTVTQIKDGLHGTVISHTDENDQSWDFVAGPSTRSISLLTRDIRLPADAKVATWTSKDGLLGTAVYDKDEEIWSSVGGVGQWRNKFDFESFLRREAEDAQFYEEIE